MGLSFKKKSGGGGDSGTKPRIGSHRAATPKPPTEQDLLGNSAIAQSVTKPEEEVSPLLAPPLPETAAKGPPNKPLPPLPMEMAEKVIAPPQPIEQEATQVMPPLPEVPAKGPPNKPLPPLPMEMAEKQVVAPPALEQPAVTLDEAPAKKERPKMVRQNAKANLKGPGAQGPQPAVTPTPTPAPEEPKKKKKRSLFGGKKKEKKDAGPLQSVRDKDVAKKKKLNGGSAHAVTQIQTKKAIGSSGSTTGYFKTDPKQEEAASAISAGIGQEKGDSHMAARAVASSRIDQLVGTNVLTDDRFGQIGGKKGLVSPQAQGSQFAKKEWREIDRTSYVEAYAPMGPDMAKEEGGKYFKYDGMSAADVDLSNPVTQKGMADLGVMDYLAGQVDRHTGNVFVDPETGKVTGIDNDMAFGTEDYAEKSGKNGVKGLPSMIDAQTADKLLGTDRDAYEATLRGQKGDHGKLSDEEITNAMKRFDDMRGHVAALKENGGLVSTWDANTFAQSEKDAEKITDFDAGNNLMSRMINTQNGAVKKH